MSLVLKRDPDGGGYEYYLVYDGEVCVGRVFQMYAQTSVPGNWKWSVEWRQFTSRGCKPPQYGEVETRDEAMAAFRKAWDSGSVM